MAGGEVQTCVPAEVVKDTEISSFKVGSNVTAAGTKYSFNGAAYFDAKALQVYTGENKNNIVNLKDTTYNIYLDTYGNLIGLEEVDAVDNYVFMTGADNGNSKTMPTPSSWTAPPRSSRSATPRATALLMLPSSTSGSPTPWTRTACTP